MPITLVSIVCALSLSMVAGAVPSRSLNARIYVSIPSYHYAGCYTEATYMRALSAGAYYGDGMTVETCAASCSGFTYFGVEYGRECYCGNSLNPGSVAAPEGDCDFPCSGNGAETCGGGSRLNVYTTNQVAVPVSEAYVSNGCYSEGTNQRALSGLAYYSDDMTVEMCATACAGFTYFGVEYGRECYCGNSFSAGSVPVAEGECNFNCPGNRAETCGAGSRLNVYVFTTTSSASSTSSLSVPTSTSSVSGPSTSSVSDPPSTTSVSNPTSTTSVSNPTSTTSVPAAGSTGYTSQGCYTEGTSERALSGLAFYNNGMTVEMCATTCAGFTYFGLEYGRECYCGNSFSAGSVPTPADQCNFNCPGNSAETCGAGSRLNVYAFSPTSTAPPTVTPSAIAQGCYTEATYGRALTGASNYDDSMTVEICEAFCAGWTWFGVEYGRECYCGNTIMPGSVQTATAQCNFPCPGNPSEYCGGSDRLNMYYLAPVVPTTSSFTTVSSSTSSSSTSSSTSSSSTTSSSTTPLSTTSSSTTSSSTTSSSTTSSSTTSSSTCTGFVPATLTAPEYATYSDCGGSQVAVNVLKSQPQNCIGFVGNTIQLGAFVAGSYTAANCVVAFYYSSSCTGTPAFTAPASSDSYSCYNTYTLGAFALVCSNPSPICSTSTSSTLSPSTTSSSTSSTTSPSTTPSSTTSSTSPSTTPSSTTSSTSPSTTPSSTTSSTSPSTTPSSTTSSSTTSSSTTSSSTTSSSTTSSSTTSSSTTSSSTTSSSTTSSSTTSSSTTSSSTTSSSTTKSTTLSTSTTGSSICSANPTATTGFVPATLTAPEYGSPTDCSGSPWVVDVLKSQPQNCIQFIGNTVQFGAFVAGSYTTANCVVAFYSSYSCTGTPSFTAPVSSDTCYNTDSTNAFALVCSNPSPICSTIIAP